MEKPNRSQVNIASTVRGRRKMKFPRKWHLRITTEKNTRILCQRNDNDHNTVVKIEGHYNGIKNFKQQPFDNLVDLNLRKQLKQELKIITYVILILGEKTTKKRC